MLGVEECIEVIESEPASGHLLCDHLNVVLLKLTHVLGKLPLHALFCEVGALLDGDRRYPLDRGYDLLSLLHLAELIAELAEERTNGPLLSPSVVVEVVTAGAGLSGEGCSLLPG